MDTNFDILNFEEDIPIIIEEDEDAISFIERTYKEKCLPQRKQNSPNKGNMNILNTKDIDNCYGEGEKLYVRELINSYKARISFLEDEFKKKDIIINKLINLTNNLVKESNKKTSNSDFHKDDEHHSIADNSDDTLSDPICELNTETPTKEKLPSILTEQLTEVRKNKHSHYLNSKMETDIIQRHAQKVYVIGDSMINGINEKDLTTEKEIVKVRYYSGAKVNDIGNKVTRILEDKPNAIILHVGTNDAVSKPSNVIIDEILSLKNSIERKLPTCKVILSSLTPRVDNGKAALTIQHFNKHLNKLKLNIMDNSNISTKDLGKKGLHLSNFGKRKFTKNISSIITKLFDE